MYPNDAEKTYGESVRERSDVDPYDETSGPFMYRVLFSSHPVDTPWGRVEIPAGEAVLYSKGRNLEDDLAEDHRDDAAAGDLVIWPPMRVLARQQGLLD